MRHEEDTERIKGITDSKQRIEELEKSNSTYQKVIKLLTHQSNHQHTTQKPSYTNEEDPKLAALAQKWLAVKEQSLKPVSLASVKGKIMMFNNIIHEITCKESTISEITETTIRKFKEILGKIPAHRNAKELAKLSLIELSELGNKPISIKTYKDSTLTVSEFLRWAESEGFPVNHKVVDILKSVRKASRSDRIMALPFSDEDLITIFNSSKYISGKVKRATDYWVPLIALFTGARLGEICQLHVTDIRKENKIWIFDINAEDGKNLKTEDSSKRLIPIHSQLISLGLIKYKEKLANNKINKLFPDEVITTLGKYDTMSKRFSNLIKILGILDKITKKQRKSFHSFRHTVRTRLADASLSNGIIDSIVGHESNERSVGEKVYTHSDLIPQKKKAIEKISYAIDFNKISNWEKCQFNRKHQ